MRHRALLGACWATIFALLLGMPGRARATDAASVIPKTSTPVVMQEVSQDGDDWSKASDATVGQMLRYRLTGTLSGDLDEFDVYPYAFVVACDKSLRPQLKTLVVTCVSSGEEHDISSYFQVGEKNEVLEISCANLKEALPDIDSHDLIVVSYQACLTEEADLGLQAPNKSACSVRYRTRGGDRSVTPEDVALVYSFSIEVRKVDGATTSPLEGVRFALRDDMGNWFAAQSWSQDAAKRDERKTDVHGSVTFAPLGSGSFEIVEIEPLVGYIGCDPLAVHIERNVRDGLPILIASCDGAESICVDAKKGLVSILVKNERKESVAQEGRVAGAGKRASGETMNAVSRDGSDLQALAMTGERDAIPQVLSFCLGGVACLMAGMVKRLCID